MTTVPFYQYARHEAHQFWEWIDGTLDLLPPLTLAQRKVQQNLLEQLGDYTEVNGLGLVIPGPFAIRMPEEMRRGREPDLMFLPNEFVEAMQDDYVNSHGVGLVVEVSDVNSFHRDSVDKFREYQMAGIPEYWICSVDDKRAEFYVLGADNRYHPVEADGDGVYHSTVVKGFDLRVASLWKEPFT